MDVLILNKGIYLSSEDLLEKVWGYDSDADVGSVWVYISYLRKQLAKVGSGVTVKARRGTGYILQEPQG
jgi:DNA-binding response OmpR family regulator